jgi:hypothetical protein
VRPSRNRPARVSIAIALLCASAVAAGAAPLVFSVEGASMVADARTNRPVLQIEVRAASHAAVDQFLTAHAGQRISIFVDGRTTITAVARRPSPSGTIEITDAPVAAMRALIGELSMRHAKIAIDVATP